MFQKGAFKFVFSSVAVIALSYHRCVAQSNEFFETDTELRSGSLVNKTIKDNDNYFYLGGHVDGKTVHPVGYVMKIDTLGNSIWNTAESDTSSYLISSEVYDLVYSDGFIYATVKYAASQTTQTQIWKIDASDGSILWRRSMHDFASIYARANLLDYDNSQLILGYTVNYGTGSGYAYFRVLDKTTGDSLQNFSIAGYNDESFPPNRVIKDPDGNLYVVNGSSFVKLDANDFGNIIYTYNLHDSLGFESYPFLFIDDDGALFIANSSDAYLV